MPETAASAQSLTAPTAREAALKALAAYRRGKSLPDEALEQSIAAMAARDSALAMKLLYGVLQNMALCDYYISYYSSIKLNRIEPRVLDILRLSVYQIVFMTRIPHRAAVNEGVSLCAKHAGQRTVRYVNAVLRKVSQAAGASSLPPVTGSNFEEILSVRYSHPLQLVRKLCEDLGAEDAEQFMAENNSDEVPVCVQVNTLLTDTDEVLRELCAEEINASPHDWLMSCVQLRSAGDITRLTAFRKGHIYVQDAASRLAVTAAALQPGMFVLDGCAAPGGKSFASSIDMKNSGRVISIDITREKLLRITQGAERLGISNIETVLNSPRDDNAGRDSVCESSVCESSAGAAAAGGDIPGEGVADGDIPGGGVTGVSTAYAAFTGKADVVIADVPCSGFGVIRKKPDIRYKDMHAIDRLPGVQKDILQKLSECVKPGGALLYSTCTVLRRENEDVISSFLAENVDFSLESFTLPHIGTVIDGYCTLLPHIHGSDGFFICRLRRKP